MSRADTLRRQIATLADELARLESRPQEPDEGSVIRFQAMFPDSFDRRYNYAAIRAGGRWYTTGKGPQRVTWDGLLDWMSGKVTHYEVLQPASSYVEL